MSNSGNGLRGSILRAGRAGSRTAVATWWALCAASPLLAQQVTCWGQTDELVAGDGWKDDRFGSAVSIWGDWAAVGALGDDLGQLLTTKEDAGSVYLFRRGAQGWKQATKLFASDYGPKEYFGTSVSLYKDTLFVGPKYHGHGGCQAVFLFERNQGGTNAWGQVRELFGSGCAFGDNFGFSVSVWRDTLVVGARQAELVSGAYEGAIHVFERDQGGPNAWGEVRKIFASDASEHSLFGHSVAIAGDTIVVGAPWTRLSVGQKAGAAYVFERDLGGPNAWGQAAKLTAGDGAKGDEFGFSVSVRGDVVVVGAYMDDHAGVVDAGSAYVFGRDHGGSGAWGQVRKLVSFDAMASDWFGHSVGAATGRAVIGARQAKSTAGTWQGAAYVFAADLGGVGNWGQMAKLVASNAGKNDSFGYSVAMSGSTVIVGAIGEDTQAKNAGAAYVFDDLSQDVPYCTAGTSGSGCQALLTTCGAPSATASSGFVLAAAGIEGGENGTFFFGPGGRQASPWGSGTSFQCIRPPVKRAGPLTGIGTPGACDGSFTLDLNARWCPTCPKAGQNPGAGATVQAQLWYLDPLNPSKPSSSLSNAVEFQVGP